MVPIDKRFMKKHLVVQNLGVKSCSRRWIGHEGNLFAKSPSDIMNVTDTTNPKETEGNRGPPYSPPQSPKNDNDVTMMNFSTRLNGERLWTFCHEKMMMESY